MAKKIVSALGRNSNSTSTGGDDSYKQKNVAEYTVAKKVEGSYKTQRFLYIVVLGVVLIAVIALFTWFAGAFGLLGSLAMSALGAWIIWFFTHRYLEIEYSYAIENAELICTTIYGNKSDKLMLQIKMANIEKTAPYEGSGKDEADSAQNIIDLRSTANTDQAYYCLYTKDTGEKGAVIFEATNKTLTAFKYYNGQTTVMREMKR